VPAHPITAQQAAAGVVAEARASSFATVYRRWFRTVHHWARVLGGPASDTEDLVQEVFIVVQRKLNGFDGRNVSGWLYQITARVVSDHRRRRWFRSLFLREAVEIDQLVDLAPDAEQELSRKQDQQRFYRLVGRLNAKWRDSFVLFEVGGYGGDEIATLQGLPAATIRTHLHRARKQFLALLEKEHR
jgi:RNA polymerase sigma-70 factor (ECF subfamily)